ncbi:MULTISPECIES: helix-turn-helix domain-containing protein [unclassified Frondihabitans]|uniref:helix-turn-helix domain-containing protein n=1 Tax=unclassified Frondihabitans TaxID=2626248 RepID=UPI000F4F681C|nr:MULTISPECIES: helix-turn-helix domain-containing protein [unclassified Frondihabitans]
MVAKEWSRTKSKLSSASLGPRFVVRLQKRLALEHISVDSFLDDFFRAFDTVMLALPAVRRNSREAHKDPTELDRLSRIAHSDPVGHKAAILAEWTADMLSTWSVDQAAELLRMSPRVIRDMIGRGELFAVMVNGDWRLARWQFPFGDLLPRCNAIASCLTRAGITWDESKHIMMFPYIVGPGGCAMSAVDWLRSGGSARAVMELVSTCTAQEGSRGVEVPPADGEVVDS